MDEPLLWLKSLKNWVFFQSSSEMPMAEIIELLYYVLNTEFDEFTVYETTNERIISLSGPSALLPTTKRLLCREDSG